MMLIKVGGCWWQMLTKPGKVVARRTRQQISKSQRNAVARTVQSCRSSKAVHGTGKDRLSCPLELQGRRLPSSPEDARYANDGSQPGLLDDLCSAHDVALERALEMSPPDACDAVLVWSRRHFWCRRLAFLPELKLPRCDVGDSPNTSAMQD